ncbi:MAG: 4Fe-4S dicluster domain-containing protein [Candidatus Eisenbacteria bacterium]|nr:4Fe-4S dicluster domain-containing protein [Candidatus Eisenbacteria bacterium]
MSAQPESVTTPARSWFDSEDAPGRRDLETCIHCGLCLTACPTYRELKIEPDSPRGRLYLMRGLNEGRIAPSDPLVEHLDNCLGCRACETVCPAGVPYGRLLEETRGQLDRRRATRETPMRALGRWTLRHVVPRRERMHVIADLLRLGQWSPIAALMRSDWARRLLPPFAIQGFAMTPPLEPRDARSLERVAPRLPAGARMEATEAALVFLPAGTAKTRVWFFTSCVMEVMFPRVNHEAVRLLVLAGCRVEVPRAQTCCGALHAHAGLRREARVLARTNVAAFADAGYDFVVHDSAGCGATLRECGHLLDDGPDAERAARFAAITRDLSQVLAAVGLPDAPASLRSPRDPSRPLRVAYHDPCHLAHGQGVRAEPRALLRRLPGADVVDLANADWCCGSAGVYNLTHPVMADAQLEKKLDTVERAAPDVVVASNPGCLLHMRRGAAARGLDVRMAHIAEVLGEAYPAPEMARAPAR